MLRLRVGSCELLTKDIVETLENHKYFTALDLCKRSPEIVAEECGIPVKNVVALQRLLQAQQSAKVVSAVDVYRDLLTSTAGFSTGINELDSLLNGGVICGETVEFYGKSAAGKTQICFHISAHVSAVACQPVLYIDTCGSFSAERIRKIMVANKVPSKQMGDALSRISCLPCFNVYDFLAKLEDLLRGNVKQNELDCRLIIIDSVATLLLPSIGGANTDGHGIMNRIANKLKELAVRHRKIIVTTNHLVTWENKSYAALGKLWSHFPHVRLKLSVEKEDVPSSPYRVAEIVKSTRTGIFVGITNGCRNTESDSTVFSLSIFDSAMACRLACSNIPLLRSSLCKNVNYRSSIKNIATYTSLHSKEYVDNHNLPRVGRQLNSDLKSLGSKGFLRSLKEYNPPADVPQRVFGICAEYVNLKEGRKANLESTVLTDRTQRFKILTKCISEFGHNISNSQLHLINTIGDIIDYFSIPVRTTTTLDDFKNAPSLPPNLHVQQEYLRFHPDTDTMFGGVSVFPGRSTIVSGLKSRKKYKGYKANYSPYDQI